MSVDSDIKGPQSVLRYLPHHVHRSKNLGRYEQLVP